MSTRPQPQSLMLAFSVIFQLIFPRPRPGDCSLSESLVRSICRNAAHLRVIRGTCIAHEYRDKVELGGEQGVLDWMVSKGSRPEGEKGGVDLGLAGVSGLGSCTGKRRTVEARGIVFGMRREE